MGGAVSATEPSPHPTAPCDGEAPRDCESVILLFWPDAFCVKTLRILSGEKKIPQTPDSGGVTAVEGTVEPRIPGGGGARRSAMRCMPGKIEAETGDGRRTEDGRRTGDGRRAGGDES